MFNQCSSYILEKQANVKIFKFLHKLSLSFNNTYYSNEHETYNFIEVILVAYISKVRKQESLSADQKCFFLFSYHGFAHWSDDNNCFRFVQRN